MSELLKEAKISRRNAKATLTRAGKTLRHTLHVQRPAEEVKQSLTKLQEAYEKLITKHEELTKLIEDDAEFETEEAWLADCQEAFMNFEIEGKKHLDEAAKQVSKENITNSQPSASDAHNENNSDQNENNNVNLEQVLADNALSVSTGSQPVTTGGEGIGTNYDAAWEYLDSIYGYPRVVSDTVMQDIVKFRAVNSDEDGRFCELVHLVKRSYNTLKEVGLPNDMDNSHMLSIIEKKMCVDDRKVWSRDLEKDKKTASLHGLMTWMNVEMKSRMRASAPLRTSTKHSINHLKQFQGGEDQFSNHRCWLCKTSSHWVDQCPKFSSLNHDQRLQCAREHHACYSCLKRASRNHRMSNCSRRKQCMEKENGVQCVHFHHPLYRNGSQRADVTSVTTDQEALLPVISVNIDGENNLYKRGNVLLDSGAQLSLIRQETAETLGLEGDNISITLTKVGGEEEEISTKVYKIQVSPPDSNKRFVIKAEETNGSIRSSNDSERECYRLQCIFDMEELIRVTAWVLWLKNNLMAKIKPGNEARKANQAPLTPEELEQSRIYWIKHTQTSLEERVKKNEFKMLTPFVDADGIIRVRGRVDNAVVSYETKHPVLLPYSHRVSRLITEEAHRCGHSGIATTAAKTRRMYWIIRVHDIAKAVKFKCVVSSNE
ncbi:PREDICTED: uncharacterized protein LOC107334806 [Paramuricea clavata]|uniref:PREDICTED: uncharacterized protein LOC107334806 n=1 Tax=Paramuricea clavata TaxID=317549 RepID=A0A7D9H7T9_PARCT|nr:PREDICTED: uncharacterized protein LOC107334806 [Paramuricea clavata]